MAAQQPDWDAALQGLHQMIQGMQEFAGEFAQVPNIPQLNVNQQLQQMMQAQQLLLQGQQQLQLQQGQQGQQLQQLQLQQGQQLQQLQQQGQQLQQLQQQGQQLQQLQQQGQQLLQGQQRLEAQLGTQSHNHRARLYNSRLSSHERLQHVWDAPNHTPANFPGSVDEIMLMNMTTVTGLLNAYHVDFDGQDDVRAQKLKLKEFLGCPV
jgi:hypothetical protein